VAKARTLICANNQSPALPILVRMRKILSPQPTGAAPTASSIGSPQVSIEHPSPICAAYESCLKSGVAALQSSQWDQSLAYFQAASEINPSQGDAWAMIGYAYFELGRYDDALGMSEKALRLGAMLTANVCLTLGTKCETNWVRVNTKEVSLVDSRGQRVFAASPANVNSQVAQLSQSGKSAYLSLQVSGRTYNLFLIPIGLNCTAGPDIECPEPGFTQQKVFADHVHQALVRIASGEFQSSPSSP
jgi:tetratricopeptide (TPR) repeat protein